MAYEGSPGSGQEGNHAAVGERETACGPGDGGGMDEDRRASGCGYQAPVASECSPDQ